MLWELIKQYGLLVLGFVLGYVTCALLVLAQEREAQNEKPKTENQK